MRLLAVGTGARALWRAALREDPGAVATQTPQWLDALCDLGRHRDDTRAYETDDGRCVVLPLARRRGPPGPLSLAGSLPYGWSAGGLVGSTPETAGHDVAGVVADLIALPALRTEVQPVAAASPAWEASAPRGVARLPLMSQVVDLTGGVDRVWSAFSASARRNARRAEKLGLEVRSDDAGGLMPVLAALYRASVERWAHRQHEPPGLARWRAHRRDPPEKFAAVGRRLGPACRVWVASRDGAPAAAIVVVSHGEHAMQWRGAMDEQVARGTGANELLQRLAIEAACHEGRRSYDMGTSSPGSHLAEFKARFGAVERHHAVFRFERLPLTAAEAAARRGVKRALRFRDA